MASGLGELYTTYVGTCTAEGDNYLMTLQTARYLIKSLHKSTVPERVSSVSRHPKLTAIAAGCTRRLARCLRRLST